MKFCKDCQYYENYFTDKIELNFCLRKKKKKTSILNGLPVIMGMKFASQERQGGFFSSRLFGECGFEGRFFKEKNK